jgi:orotate phosphoribosyltransferase
MKYRSVAQLSDDVWAWSQRLPPDIDLVVGIPRSGLLAANLLAVYRNLPLTDVDGLLEGRFLLDRRRNGGAAPSALPAQPLSVLVVDDSVRTGRAMQEIKEQLATAATPHRFCYGAVYVRPGAEAHVDFYFEQLGEPRWFEWNILNRSPRRVGVVLDGVICPEPPVEVEEDVAAYRDFLARVEPLHLFPGTIPWLITSRREKQRAALQEWLARHGVLFEELVMTQDQEHPASRTRQARDAFKAGVLRRTDARFLIEPSLFSAIQITRLATKPVFCTATRQMIYPGLVPRDRYTTPAEPARRRLLSRLRAGVRQVRAQVAGRLSREGKPSASSHAGD